MKVLVSAYACEPEKGSEPYVGWTWTPAIAKVVDEVHVITRANNREPIEIALKNRPGGNMYFHYFDLPARSQFWKKRILCGTQLYYLLWQRAVGEFALKLHEKQHFDIVHHITFAGMVYPPGVAKVPTTFIWGPIGLIRVPSGLKRSLHLKAKLAEFAHDALIFWTSHNQNTQNALEKASLILMFPNNALIEKSKANPTLVGNIFLDPDRFPSRRRGEQRKELQLVTLTRLIFWKGLDLGLEALAILKRKGLKFKWNIIGDGPEKTRWQHLAGRLGLQDCVSFSGWMRHGAALEVLNRADLMLHPAFREGWGGVVLEGMAAGIPVICLDWGGPGFTVDDETGIKVSVEGGREAIINGLAQGIEQLLEPSLRRTMGVAARQRIVEHFSLKALDGVVEEIYRGVLS